MTYTKFNLYAKVFELFLIKQAYNFFLPTPYIIENFSRERERKIDMYISAKCKRKSQGQVKDRVVSAVQVKLSCEY